MKAVLAESERHSRSPVQRRGERAAAGLPPAFQVHPGMPFHSSGSVIGEGSR